MDKDLTLEMCVPSLRWIEAHRMHRKIPIWRATRQSRDSTGGKRSIGAYVPTCPCCNTPIVSESRDQEEKGATNLG